LSNAELSKIVNLSPPATHARLKRLEQRGYIDKYIAVLNKEKLNFDLVCIIFINTQTHEIKQLEEFEERVIAMPQILECLNLTGEFDYMLKAILRNREELQAFIRRLTNLKSDSKLQTCVTMREIMFTTNLSLFAWQRKR